MEQRDDVDGDCVIYETDWYILWTGWKSETHRERKHLEVIGGEREPNYDHLIFDGKEQHSHSLFLQSN